MNSLVQELVGRKVTVYSTSGSADSSDIGVIERADDHWIKLRKNDKEVLFLNVLRIRLIKPFEPL